MTSRTTSLPASFLIRAAGLGILAGGLAALALGQDANWDLRNYHYYNPYAWLHGRLGYDIAPAQVATYYNPLLHLPFYLVVEALPPRLVGFLLGALQGLCLVPLAAISLLLLPPEPQERQQRLALVLGLIGLAGAGSVSELGTSFGDGILALPILASLWLLLRQQPLLATPGCGRGLLLALAAGLLTGLTAGLKQPAAVYAVGLCLACLALAAPWSRRILVALVFGLGVLAGIALTGGWWLLTMWQEYGNPLFPYFNHLFRSEMAAIADYRDSRFLPQGLGEAFFFPLFFLAAPEETAEVAFRDGRLPMAALLFILVLLTRRRRPVPAAATREGCRQGLFLVFVLGSYLAWLKLFAIYRYLLVLEILAPVAIWLLVARLLPEPAPARRWGTICLGVVLLVTRPADWGREPWRPDFFGVQVPALDDPAHTVVLMAGVDPMSYLIPFFPAPVRFLRIQSYFTGPSATPNGTDRLLARLVAGHRGPAYVLYRSYEGKAAGTALAAYGLAADLAACQKLRPGIESRLPDPLLFCPVAPIPEADKP
ncbi:MAG: hypothetical protein AB1634_03015 [Thermodesulfobacteriota bacterium]